MRAFFLTLVLGLMTFGSLAVAPSEVRAQELRPGVSPDIVAVRWWRERYYGPGYWWRGSYYGPGYWGSYYGPSYYPTYQYYYGTNYPGFSPYATWPGYSAYYPPPAMPYYSPYWGY
jgi:hypothetical protein